ncbi:hypothetical protein ACFFX0_13595 [Citricoccus parietis]|uniref:Uncharacterized protein n=1 Tax=Citricoccus parietis TaxID=592307 RepID=A0ABV5FZR5_9MICC
MGLRVRSSETQFQVKAFDSSAWRTLRSTSPEGIVVGKLATTTWPGARAGSGTRPEPSARSAPAAAPASSVG